MEKSRFRHAPATPFPRSAGRGEHEGSADSLLLKSRIIYLTGQIGFADAHEIIARLLYLESLGGGP